MLSRVCLTIFPMRSNSVTFSLELRFSCHYSWVQWTFKRVLLFTHYKVRMLQLVQNVTRKSKDGKKNLQWSALAHLSCWFSLLLLKKILKFVTVVNMSFLDNNHPNWRQFIDTFSSDVFYSLTVILYLKVWALLCTVRRAPKIS